MLLGKTSLGLFRRDFWWRREGGNKMGLEFAGWNTFGPPSLAMERFEGWWGVQGPKLCCFFWFSPFSGPQVGSYGVQVWIFLVKKALTYPTWNIGTSCFPSLERGYVIVFWKKVAKSILPETNPASLPPKKWMVGILSRSFSWGVYSRPIFSGVCSLLVSGRVPLASVCGFIPSQMWGDIPNTRSIKRYWKYFIYIYIFPDTQWGWYIYLHLP